MNLKKKDFIDYYMDSGSIQLENPVGSALKIYLESDHFSFPLLSS